MTPQDIDDIRLTECGGWLRHAKHATGAARYRMLRHAEYAARAIRHPYWRWVALEWVAAGKRQQR